jgi:hypothetical protein
VLTSFSVADRVILTYRVLRDEERTVTA